ncbi:MAG: AraC family transcriptional regulator [Gammaproteobacteria bacterium]|nr:MAG: AraC family transcriptional regulator [Gammaproteobacteria bacterium]
MKPMYEKVLPTENSSWRYWLYALDEIPFSWHYHPEYEICLTLNSRGQRYIGEHIADYDHFDFVLLGPKLPHTWCSKTLIEPGQHLTYVAQLPTKWVESLAQQPELNALTELLEKSKYGVEFSQATAQQACKLFDEMANATPLQRLIGLLEMLRLMLADTQTRVICKNDYAPNIFPDSSTEKIDKVIAYIHDHYTENLKAEQLADLIHMSTNHFHNFFKQRTEQTFTELINKLRIGKACSMLLNTDLSVAIIGERCGFNNLSNFNRRFLQIKDCTPREFRYDLKVNSNM